MISLFLPIVGIVLMVIVPVALILWIVRVLRHQEATPLTAAQVRHGLIGTAVAVVATVFLILLTNQLAADYPANFGVGVTLAAVTFVGALAIRQLPTVGTSLIVAALATLSYSFGVHGGEFDAGTKLVVSLVGLAVTVALADWATWLNHRIGAPSHLTSVRTVLVGLAVVVLSLLATGFATALTGFTPGDGMDGIPDRNGGLGLAVTFVAGLTWLTIGSVARRVPAISVGFLVAGAIAFLSSLVFIVTTIKGVGPVFVTGAVLVGLILLAYRSLRHE